MRNRFLAATGTFALALATACDSPTAPASAVRQSAALATPEKGTDLFVLEDESMFIDCLDEVGSFTVTIPLAYHTVTTPSGNTVYMDRLLWSQGTGTMVGLTSGTVWTMQRIIGPLHIEANRAGERFAFEATQWWVSDSGQRMHVHSTYFLRHDAGGNLVVERDVYRCRVL